jgi:hypothetical protein
MDFIRITGASAEGVIVFKTGRSPSSLGSD